MTIVAFRDADERKAREVMKRHAEIKRKTDDLLASMVSDPAAGRGTVALAVASRYYRRISAHASNVASALVNPLDQVTRDAVPGE